MSRAESYEEGALAGGSYLSYGFTNGATVTQTYSTYESDIGGSAYTYPNIYASGKMAGLSEQSFTWYKYNETTGDWEKYTTNVRNNMNGTWAQSKLSFKSINEGGRFKCVISTTITQKTASGATVYTKTYVNERECTVVLLPSSVALSAKAQTVSIGQDITRTASNSTASISKGSFLEDLPSSAVYSRITISLADGIDTSVPGIYPGAIIIEDVSLDTLSGAENYTFSFKSADLIVKGTPEFNWQGSNVYTYGYTGEAIDPSVSVELSGTDELGDPSGSVKILYNGSDSLPSEVG